MPRSRYENGKLVMDVTGPPVTQAPVPEREPDYTTQPTPLADILPAVEPVAPREEIEEFLKNQPEVLRRRQQQALMAQRQAFAPDEEYAVLGGLGNTDMSYRDQVLAQEMSPRARTQRKIAEGQQAMIDAERTRALTQGPPRKLTSAGGWAGWMPDPMKMSGIQRQMFLPQSAQAADVGSQPLYEERGTTMVTPSGRMQMLQSDYNKGMAGQRADDYF